MVRVFSSVSMVLSSSSSSLPADEYSELCSDCSTTLEVSSSRNGLLLRSSLAGLLTISPTELVSIPCCCFSKSFFSLFYVFSFLSFQPSSFILLYLQPLCNHHHLFVVYFLLHLQMMIFCCLYMVLVAFCLSFPFYVSLLLSALIHVLSLLFPVIPFVVLPFFSSVSHPFFLLLGPRLLLDPRMGLPMPGLGLCL